VLRSCLSGSELATWAGMGVPVDFVNDCTSSILLLGQMRRVWESIQAMSAPFALAPGQLLCGAGAVLVTG
jgi:hypothetical protein